MPLNKLTNDNNNLLANSYIIYRKNESILIM